MSINLLPTLNAILNATSGILVLIGYVMIRRKKVYAHRACMIGAVTTSIIFLISYVIYHSQAGATRFAGTGWSRPFYFTILISHTILAITIVPFVIVTLRRALKGQFARHLKIAKWTFPMWLYVSITGVLVYFLLYHWFPSRP
jgi:putative membrane protein